MAEQKPKDRLSACRSIPRVCPSTTSIHSRQSHLSPSTLSLFPAILLLLLSLFSKLRQKRRPSRKTTSQPGTDEFPPSLYLYTYTPSPFGAQLSQERVHICQDNPYARYSGPIELFPPILSAIQGTSR